MLENTFQELFSYLRASEYAWESATPDQLSKYRRGCEEGSQDFDPLVRYFGLGLDVSRDELRARGLPEKLLSAISTMRPGISRCGEFFVPFARQGSVYLGQESFELLRLIQPALEGISEKNVLDLGSGSGIQTFEIAGHAKRVLGLEASLQAVEWSRAAARAQGLMNVTFEQAPIGESRAEELASADEWDVAVFNPPMAVPSPGGPRPHRDGGNLGVELPLRFLSFAKRHLRAKGEVFCLVTSPIVNGRSIFFDQMDSAQWDSLEKRRLNPSFNQSLYRKQRYSELSIERVELWYLHLQKRA